MPTRDHPPEVLALLRAARETGLLEVLLTETASPAAAARAADVDERAAEVAVETLAATGYLDRVDDGYEPTNRALGLLTKTDLRSIGSTPRELDLFDALCALPETMRTGSPPDLSDDRARNDLGARLASDEATVRAVVTAAHRVAPDATDVLVLAGAPGAVAGEFAARGCAVTLVDETDAVDAIRPLLDESVECVTAPVTELPPERFDLAVTVDYAHQLTPAEYRHLAGAAHDVLSTGGHLVVVDRLRDRSASGPALDVEALATTEGGRAHDAATARSFFDDAGFEAVAVADVPGTDRQTVAGRRPRD
jgi:hypothetical protein